MIRTLSAPSKRIAVALAVSLLLHGWFFWGVNLRLPRHHSAITVLQVKLQPLPAAPEQPQTGLKLRMQPLAAAAHAPPAHTTPARQPAPPAPAAAETPAAPALPLALPLADSTERRPMPHRAQLTFALYRGEGGRQTGEIVHSMTVDDGHYELQAITRMAGDRSTPEKFALAQTSSGYYSRETGFRPHQFVEERGGQEAAKPDIVSFDFEAQMASYSRGYEQSIPPDIQDSLSALYQFPPLTGAESVSAFISSAEKVENVQFEIAEHENIDTPFGKLLTIHLKKIRADNGAGWEIWLAREYRLFPVKMRIIEAGGAISSEAIITDIRVEDAPQEEQEK